MEDCVEAQVRSLVPFELEKGQESRLCLGASGVLVFDHHCMKINYSNTGALKWPYQNAGFQMHYKLPSRGLCENLQSQHMVFRHSRTLV